MYAARSVGLTAVPVIHGMAAVLTMATRLHTCHPLRYVERKTTSVGSAWGASLLKVMPVTDALPQGMSQQVPDARCFPADPWKVGLRQSVWELALPPSPQVLVKSRFVSAVSHTQNLEN